MCLLRPAAGKPQPNLQRQRRHSGAHGADWCVVFGGAAAPWSALQLPPEPHTANVPVAGCKDVLLSQARGRETAARAIRLGQDMWGKHCPTAAREQITDGEEARPGLRPLRLKPVVAAPHLQARLTPRSCAGTHPSTPRQFAIGWWLMIDAAVNSDVDKPDHAMGVMSTVALFM